VGRIFHSTPITERNRATTDRPKNKNKQLQPRTDQTDRPPQKKPETKEDTQQQPTTGPRVSFQATQEQTDPVKGGENYLQSNYLIYYSKIKEKHCLEAVATV
jgi:hypothetical protein